MFLILLLVAAVAALVTWLTSLCVYRVAMRYRIHPPVRERDVHSRPTPRLGGVAMFIGLLAAFIVASFIPQFSSVFSEPLRIVVLLGAVTLIVVVGVLDDLIELDWMLKLGAQLAVAIAIALYSVQIVSLPIAGLTVGSATLSITSTVLVLVLIMNAVNFIDGLDALVAGVTIIGATAFFTYIWILSQSLGQQNATFSLASLITAIVIGVCLGVLPLNWHPAKMFIGDAGALMVGLLTAVSAIAVTGQIDIAVVGGRSQLVPAFIPILLPLAILLMPLLDFVLAVLRRLLNGKSPFSADRKHLHHRLLDMGHSHFGAVLTFYAWTAVVSIGCIMFLFVPPWTAVTFVLVGFFICAIVTALPVTPRLWHSFLRLVRVRTRELREQGAEDEEQSAASNPRETRQ